MTRILSLLGAAALAFGLVVPVRAQTPIPLAGKTDGNASTQTAAYGITPSAGTSQFLLTTINPAASLPQDGSLGTTPSDTNVTTLNTYFGLAAGTLAGMSAQDGSGYLTQPVTLAAGMVVHFDYLFLTSEDNTLPTTPAPSQYHNDLAFYTINGVATQLYSAGQLTAAQQNLGSNSQNFDFQSPGTQTGGYQRVDYTVPTTGNYTLGFGVIDVDTNTIQSGLLIDNINYSLPSGNVPEPATVALLALGAGGGLLAAARRRARRSL